MAVTVDETGGEMHAFAFHDLATLGGFCFQVRGNGDDLSSLRQQVVIPQDSFLPAGPKLEPGKENCGRSFDHLAVGMRKFGDPLVRFLFVGGVTVLFFSLLLFLVIEILKRAALDPG